MSLNNFILLNINNIVTLLYSKNIFNVCLFNKGTNFKILSINQLNFYSLYSFKYFFSKIKILFNLFNLLSTKLLKLLIIFSNLTL